MINRINEQHKLIIYYVNMYKSNKKENHIVV